MINLTPSETRSLYLSVNDIRELNGFMPEIRHFTYKNSNALRYTLKAPRAEVDGKTSNWVIGTQSIRLGPVLAVNYSPTYDPSPQFRLIKLTGNLPGHVALLSHLDGRVDGDERPIPEALLAPINRMSAPSISLQPPPERKKGWDGSWGEVPAALIRLLDSQQSDATRYIQMEDGPAKEALIGKMESVSEILDDVFSRTHLGDFNRVRSQKTTTKPSVTNAPLKRAPGLGQSAHP